VLIIRNAYLLERYFDVMVRLITAGGGEFDFAAAVEALQRDGLYDDVDDPRQRSLVANEQAIIGLNALTRAKLISRADKPNLTRSLRLFTVREVGALTWFGGFLAGRGPIVRLGYLILWCLLDCGARLKHRWAWLIGISQTIAWGIGWWRLHSAVIERQAAAGVTFVGLILSALAVWVVRAMTQ
jgi:hypothetical protein